MGINLENDIDKVLKDIKIFVFDNILTQFPFLKKDSSIVVSGSVATECYDKDSDIDIHVIRSENLDTILLNRLKDYKKILRESGSNIELRFASTYEKLEDNLGWNTDYILGEINNYLIIFDYNNRLTELVSKFNWYPSEIYEEKIKWLLSEMLIIIQREINSATIRNQGYYLRVLKVKYVKYALTILRLLNKKYPVYDKKSYETTLKLPTVSKDLKLAINEILSSKDKDKIPNVMLKVHLNLVNLVESETHFKSLKKEDLLNFSTKNKIRFE
ncbi:DUF4037 domain-containing protein [bacterium]|nr:DUF4037 domain-containing protein [bacterium]